MTCRFGYITRFQVGYINLGGVQYAAGLNVTCSDGQVVLGPATPRTFFFVQSGNACSNSQQLSDGPLKGACRSTTLKFVTTGGLEGVTGLADTGRSGTGMYFPSCPVQMGVLTGISFKRWAGGSMTKAGTKRLQASVDLTNVMHSLTCICSQPSPAPPPPPSPSPPRAPPSPATPRLRPPPPSVLTARAYGDPHFSGFDGSKFSFSGVPGSWYELLGSKSPPFSLKSKFVASTQRPKFTYMRAFEFRNGTSKVEVDLLPPLPSRPAIWRIQARANGKLVPAGATGLTIGTGIRVTLTTGNIGVFGRVVIDAGYIRVAVIQKWRPQRAELADFLDVNLYVYSSLRLPATGILGTTYINAVQSRRSRAGAASVKVAAQQALQAWTYDPQPGEELGDTQPQARG